MLDSDDIDAFNRDQHRREAWKRRGRQAAVDQAGCCTGESECPCPNCREYREFYRLSLGESLHKTHIGHDDRGRVVKWIWVRRPGGWRRKDVQTGRIFGPFARRYLQAPADADGEITSHYTRTTNPDSAENWVRSMFTDPPAYVSLSDAVKFYRAHYGLDTPWADPWRKTTAPEQAKEVPMLTALQLAILSHYIVHPGVPYPYTCSSRFGTVSQALADLVAEEFLERRPDGGHKITPRTTVYFCAINTLPLPIRKQTPWVMPETEERPVHGSRDR